jgi:hypothetical protein
LLDYWRICIHLNRCSFVEALCRSQRIFCSFK